MKIITPEDFAEYQRVVSQTVKSDILKAQDIWSIRFPEVQIFWGLKGTTAGTALARMNLGVIQFNPYIARENPEAFIKDTVHHEVSHLITEYYYDIKKGIPTKAHGPEWKGIVSRMGGIPSRCHRFDTSNVPTKFGNQRKDSVYEGQKHIGRGGINIVIS